MMSYLKPLGISLQLLLELLPRQPKAILILANREVIPCFHVLTIRSLPLFQCREDAISRNNVLCAWFSFLFQVFKRELSFVDLFAKLIIIPFTLINELLEGLGFTS